MERRSSLLRRLLALWLLLPALAASAGPLTGEDLVEIRALIHRQIDACAVSRPAAVSFLDLVVLDEHVVQQVRLTERSGAEWLAYYAMRRTEDGAWRALGCHLARPGRSISA